MSFQSEHKVYNELTTLLVAKSMDRSSSDNNLHISDHELNELALTLSRLPVEHAKMVQSLIIHHRHLEGGGEALPYDGNLLTKDRGAKYDLRQMPIKLIKILELYVSRINF